MPPKSPKPTSTAGRAYEKVDLNPPKSELEKLVEAASASRLGGSVPAATSNNNNDSTGGAEVKDKKISDLIPQVKKSKHDLTPNPSKSIRSGNERLPTSTAPVSTSTPTPTPTSTPIKPRPTSTPLLDSFRSSHVPTDPSQLAIRRSGSPGSGFIPGRSSVLGGQHQNMTGSNHGGIIGSSSSKTGASSSLPSTTTNPTIILAPPLPDLNTVLHHMRPSALPSSYPSGAITSGPITSNPGHSSRPTHSADHDHDDHNDHTANAHLQPVLIKRPGMKPRDHPVHLTFTSSTKSGPVGSRSDVGEGDDEGQVEEGGQDDDEERDNKVDLPLTQVNDGDSTQKAGSTNAQPLSKSISTSTSTRPELSIVKTSHPPFTPKVDNNSPSSPLSKRSSTSKTGKNKFSSSSGRSGPSGPTTPLTSTTPSTSGLYVVKAPPPRPEMDVFKAKRRGGGGGESNGGMNPMTMMLLTGGMQQQQQQQQQMTNNQSSNC